MSVSNPKWIVRLNFDDGVTRYYQRLDSKDASDFTTLRDEAQRFESEESAVVVRDRLKSRRRTPRHIGVEEA
jgi:hypothetical protein